MHSFQSCISFPDGKMNLHDLETFVSIAQLGGVTRAAGQLHRSQPAITRRINLLEGQLGAPLLERGRGGAVLTEAGRTFLPLRSTAASWSRRPAAKQGIYFWIAR
jgi:molybdenum-dependent DNA-binding transcriptional regulator ModE